LFKKIDSSKKALDDIRDYRHSHCATDMIPATMTTMIPARAVPHELSVQGYRFTSPKSKPTAHPARLPLHHRFNCAARR
jgi:hypothetical protein